MATQQVDAGEFKLQFDPADIPRLATCYGPEQDEAALAVGRRVRGEEFTRGNLASIFEWKTRGRGQSRLERNSDKEIADALSLAGSAKTERAAIAVLVGLHGVLVPVASAILTAINPDRYTVIDFRAREALGTRRVDSTIDFYLAYLTFCRQLADARRVTLRDFDRALWQWSKEWSAQ